MSADDADADTHDDEPEGHSIRQLLHWATGDREAEAEALADEADVSDEAAERAVRKAHGDLGVTEDHADVNDQDDLASPADAEAEAAKRRDRR